MLREELRQAALKRRERVEERTAKLTEVEQVLLRALAVTDPDGAEARLVAAEAVTNSATWFEHLGIIRSDAGVSKSRGKRSHGSGG